MRKRQWQKISYDLTNSGPNIRQLSVQNIREEENSVKTLVKVSAHTELGTERQQWNVLNHVYKDRKRKVTKSTEMKQNWNLEPEGIQLGKKSSSNDIIDML